MDIDEFWQLIATLGGRIDQRSATALSVRLAARPADEIIEFADHLASVLFAMDSSDRADQDVVDPDEGDEPIPLSDDLFLYARCAVVAAGRTVWESVVADPSALAGSRSVFDGEWLLTVAPSAFEESTGSAWTHESPDSYETGSNPEGWGDSGGDPSSSTFHEHSVDGGGAAVEGTGWVVPAPHRPWFELLGSVERRLPWVALYIHMRNAFMIAINADPAWTAWWQRSGLRDLQISLWLGPDDDESFELRRGRKICRVDVSVDGRFLTSTDRRLLLGHAHGDIERAMAFVGDQLGLGPIPPTPAGPPLPAGLDLDKPETPENQQHMWRMDWPGFRTNWTL